MRSVSSICANPTCTHGSHGCWVAAAETEMEKRKDRGLVCYAEKDALPCSHTLMILDFKV